MNHNLVVVASLRLCSGLVDSFQLVTQDLAFCGEVLLILENDVEVRVQNFQQSDPLIQQVVEKNEGVVEVNGLAELVQESKELLTVQC